MLASSSSPEFGKLLRAERDRLCLSLRDVESLSRDLAEQRKNHEYYISHSSLAEIENGERPPSIYTMYSLSAIYGRRYEQLATLFGIPATEAEYDHKALSLPRTCLIDMTVGNLEQPVIWPVELREKLRSEPTNLVSKMLRSWNDVPFALLQQMDSRDLVYGYVGLRDYTLYPFIRPGSFVLIDSSQRKILPMQWHSDFDRPVFFVELREGYACSWCELQGDQLILISTPQFLAQHSRVHPRQVRYPGEATIIGRVTTVAQHIAEDSGTP